MDDKIRQGKITHEALSKLGDNVSSALYKHVVVNSVYGFYEADL
jgi:hypothetical protein